MYIKNEDKIIYEDFDSYDIFEEEFKKKIDVLEMKADNFKTISSYDVDELNNCNIETRISEAFDDYSANLQEVTDELERLKGSLR